ncbi:M14 family metallopeptidase [Acidocella aquatica]
MFAGVNPAHPRDCASSQLRYTAFMTPGPPPADFAPVDSARPADLQAFPVHIATPDISAFRQGNTGIPGFTTHDSGLPGPHVVLVSLIHGNEIAGAAILAELLRAKFTPRRGKLTFGFANLAAFDRFNSQTPLASRHIEEDMNRVWDDLQLFGVRRSLELNRAREIRPLVDTADILLDLHTMLWPSNPVLLCGPTAQGRELALKLATPATVIADSGHAGGKRLIDYGRFSEATGILAEAGQHWEPAALSQTRATVRALLRQTGMLLAPPPPPAPITFAQVTHTITARTNRFVFLRSFQGGEIIPAADTLIAHDGDTEIRTPYDSCMLVMPSLRVSLGHTAVRLARLA